MAYTDLVEIQEKINTHKTNLATNLTNKEVEASATETLTSLISKVNDITAGGSGVDWSSITDMSHAFDSTQPSFFNTLYTSINCDMSQVTNWSYAFYNAIMLDTTDTIFKNKGIVFNIFCNYMFYGCTYLTDFNLAETITAYTNKINYCFYNCSHLPLSKALRVCAGLINTTAGMQYAFSMVGTNTDETILGDYEINTSNIQYGFRNCSLTKIGSLDFTRATSVNIANIFYGCTSLQEIGTIKANNLQDVYNFVTSGTSLKKINGFELTNQTSTIITSSFNYLLLSATGIEEMLNMPIFCFSYGGKALSDSLSGTSTEIRPLHRLTFSGGTSYLNKTNAKSFSIAYCSFNEEEMVEMFTSLPDASDVTGAKVITITGNPCVTDGTLTDEDIAIATAKGYTIQTE